MIISSQNIQEVGYLRIGGDGNQSTSMLLRLLLEYVRELVGHVHCHGTHPEEEADEDVLAYYVQDLMLYYLMKVCWLL